MPLKLSPRTHELLEKRFGKEEARELFEAMDMMVRATEKEAQEVLENMNTQIDSMLIKKLLALEEELSNP